MKERLSARLWRDVASVATLLNRPLFKKLAREAQKGGSATPAEIAEHMLRKMHIRPVYERESDAVFSEQRRTLNEKPGILICNHPLRVEVLPLLAMVTRSDVKAIASHLTVEMAAPVFGKDYFIEVEPEAGREAVQRALKEAETHIKNGGLLILFPSGSSQRDASASFRGGFRAIVKGMPPEAMVYACKANTDDLARIKKGLFMRMARLLLPGVPRQDALSVHLRMDERYTEASEWQALLTDEPAKDNRALTAHYESLFRPDGSGSA